MVTPSRKMSNVRTTTTQFRPMPVSVPNNAQSFVGRPNIMAGETKLFLGTESDLDEFKKLMRTIPVEWESAMVQQRASRMKGKPLVWNVKVRDKSGKEKSEELKADNPNAPGIKSDFEKKGKKIIDIAPKTVKKLLPKEINGKFVEWGKVEKIRRGHKVVDNAGNVIEEDPPFKCADAYPLQIRVMGTIDDVREVTLAIQKSFDKSSKLDWKIPDSKIGLSKLFTDKKDRNNGKFCSDTIRAYINQTKLKEV